MTNNKSKLFKCTSCGRKCDHTTTRYEKDGIEYLQSYEGLCRTCFNKRIRGEALPGDIDSLTTQLKNMNDKDREEILAYLTQ